MADFTVTNSQKATIDRKHTGEATENVGKEALLEIVLGDQVENSKHAEQMLRVQMLVKEQAKAAVRGLEFAILRRSICIAFLFFVRAFILIFGEFLVFIKRELILKSLLWIHRPRYAQMILNFFRHTARRRH